MEGRDSSKGKVSSLEIAVLQRNHLTEANVMFVFANCRKKWPGKRQLSLILTGNVSKDYIHIYIL